MEYVSLLPPEIRAQRLQKKRQAVFIRIAIIVFILVLIIYAFLLVSSILTRSNLNSLREEREMIESQAAALTEYEVLFNEMNAAEARLNSAMGTVPVWSVFLLDLGLTLPTGAWLSDLTVTYSGDSGSFNLRGWSYTHSGVAEMLDKIETMDQLNDIRLRTSTETTFDGRDAVQFVVDAQLRSGPPYVGDAEEPQQEEDVQENDEGEGDD